MATGDHLLAIDVGTQSIRALLFTPRGELLAKNQVQIEPYVSPEPGWAEQDPGYYWDNLCAACQGLWQDAPVGPDAVAGVSLTCQRATMINLDADGEPLRPAMVWLDQRRAEGMPAVGGLWGAALKLAGASETVAYFQAEAEANWIKTNQPEVWSKTRRYLFLSGYLTHRLTGRFVDSVGCQVGYVPFDYKRLDWARSSDWKWSALPIPRDWLPELVPPAEPLGELTGEAAGATGRPAGLPVIAAAADKACEVLGSGCLEPNLAALSFGTTATVNVTSRKYVEPVPLVPPYPSAVPGAYSLERQIYRGFWMVRWFLEELGAEERRLGEAEGRAPEEMLERLLEQTPPGSMGLVLQPYWSPGIKRPGPEAKGCMIGFGDVHKRAHIYRAILEGLGYALREGLELTERRMKTPVNELRVAGGGSQSDAAMQVTADLFGLPASRPHLYEASGLGAAMDAAVGLGLHPDFEAAVAEMTRVGQTFEPRPEPQELYEALYRRVYLKIYDRLQPLYEEIRDITGYPAR